MRQSPACRLPRRRWCLGHARHSFQPDRILCEGKNYFSIVTFAVGAIFIASPVSGVTTTSSMVTVA